MPVQASLILTPDEFDRDTSTALSDFEAGRTLYAQILTKLSDVNFSNGTDGQIADFADWTKGSDASPGEMDKAIECMDVETADARKRKQAAHDTRLDMRRLGNVCQATIEVLKMPAALDQKLTSKTGAITTPELDTIEAVAKAFSQACGKVPNGLWNPEQETALEALYTRCATLIPKLDAATNMFETTVHVVRRERFEDEVQLLRTRTNALGDFIEGDKHESVVTLW